MLQALRDWRDGQVHSRFGNSEVAVSGSAVSVKWLTGQGGPVADMGGTEVAVGSAANPALGSQEEDGWLGEGRG